VQAVYATGHSAIWHGLSALLKLALPGGDLCLLVVAANITWNQTTSLLPMFEKACISCFPLPLKPLIH